MVIPSLLVKGSLVALGAGIIGSAVAVPVTLLNGQSQIIIEKFPADKKNEYKDKCQILVTDKSEKKYLFVCKEQETSSPIVFRFYAESDEKEPELVKVKEIKQNEEDVELDLELLGTSGAGTGETKKIKDISSRWTDLTKKTLESCSFVNKEENGSWRLDCLAGRGEGAREFISIPFTIK